MNKIQTLTVALSTALLTSWSAYAADLGGSCCADLEERVAELEATTVRKGNSKVSLTLSGNVNQAIYFTEADNGDDDVRILDNGTSFTLAGSGKVSSDFSIGYKLAINARYPKVSESMVGRAPDGNPWVDKEPTHAGSWGVDNAYVYLKSASMGTLSLGKLSPATDSVTKISVGGPAQEDLPGDIMDGSVLDSRLEGDKGDEGIIRYDSPSLAGFVLSASWASDTEEVDLALRYAGTFGDVQIGGGVGYFVGDNYNIVGEEISGIGGSISAKHVPTGIFATFGAAQVDFEDRDAEVDYWYVNAGIQKKFLSAGTTTIMGEYKEAENATDNEESYIGVYLSQGIDAAATTLYAHYRNLEDAAGDEYDYVLVGAKIEF
jgi:hypothetical protein